MLVERAPVDAERSGLGARICAGKDMGGFFMNSSTERAVWGGVVPTGVELTTDTGASSKELPPPLTLRRRKTSDGPRERPPRHFIEIWWGKWEVMVRTPVCRNFRFPNFGIKRFQRKP